MKLRNPELTDELLPKIEEYLKSKNFCNTLRIRKKFGCTGKRVSIILIKLGWSRFGKSSRYQTYKRDGYELKE